MHAGDVALPDERMFIGGTVGMDRLVKVICFHLHRQFHAVQNRLVGLVLVITALLVSYFRTGDGQITDGYKLNIQIIMDIVFGRSAVDARRYRP